MQDMSFESIRIGHDGKTKLNIYTTDWVRQVVYEEVTMQEKQPSHYLFRAPELLGYEKDC